MIASVKHSGHPKIYRGDIVAGSLLVQESRQIARLLLSGVDDDAWHQAIVVDNVLQKRSPVTAKRQARLIKNRLRPMSSDLLRLVERGTSDIATQALLAAAVKNSRLLGDFMDNTLREHWLTFKRELSAKDWDYYLEICAQVDPVVTDWAEVTVKKLRQVIFRILAEAKYVDGSRSLRLLPVSIAPEVRSCLIRDSEDYVLRCMEVTQ